ncbi:MAG: hypothetical protein NWF00_10735 [Candidatus Bathyarchaeota archaeon]|nr:hypothetical protein [Candidatus Bathyarchaeota archaeon]
MSEKTEKFERTEPPIGDNAVIIPEPAVMPDGMLQCPRCGETFSEMDIYEDHYVEAHT